MTSQDQAVEIYGAPGSPYTRKMLAVLRFRRVPYILGWSGRPSTGSTTHPAPKVAIIPVMYFPTQTDVKEVAVDSTPIIRRLEDMHAARSVIPSDPALSFLNYLIEDFADEWLTKSMFHYRWAYDEDAKHAAPLLAFWHAPQLEAETANTVSDEFAQRQIGRLGVVGSNDITGPLIEESFTRLIDILDTLIMQNGYVLGARPSSADFALFGQLTQLCQVEPTSYKVAQRRPRVRAWVDRLEDLSGLDIDDQSWLSVDETGTRLAPLLAEIGRCYVPCLLANAAAIQKGEASFETQIDGKTWTQDIFPYQAKCLVHIREAYGALDADSQATVDNWLAGSGCEQLLTD
ncbi:MAG: Uncharacterised protein [Rhodobiaceae bacterium UBA7378]|nr:MAG: Uncharacterised protein [Rhodobiaceae bacterium UBA7378]